MALVPVAEVEPIDPSDDEATVPIEPVVSSSSDEPAEWYFSRDDRGKLGPIPSSVMIAMARQGKLKPTDPAWRPGMASWIAAAEVPEFREAFSTAIVQTPTREANPFSRCSRVLPGSPEPCWRWP